MPRTNPIIHTNYGHILHFHTHSIIVPAGQSKKAEHDTTFTESAFIVIPNREIRIELPVLCNKFFMCRNCNLFYETDNGKLIITFYEFNGTEFEVQQTVDFSQLVDLKYSIMTAIDSGTILCFMYKSVYVVDLVERKCIELEYSLVSNFGRTTILLDEQEEKYVTLLLVDDSIKTFEIPVPYNLNYKLVEVANSMNPEVLFIGDDIVYIMSVVNYDSTPQMLINEFNVQLQMSGKMQCTQCFVFDEVYYFTSNLRLVSFSFKRGKVEKCVEVSNTSFQHYTMINQELYGNYGHVMHPIETIQRNISGFCLLPNMPITINTSDVFNPMLITNRGVMHIDIYNCKSPRGIIHGVVEGVERTLHRVVANPSDGEIVYTQIYFDGKETYTACNGATEVAKICHVFEGSDYLLECVRNTLFYINESYDDVFHINGAELRMPENMWFYTTCVDSIVWIAGSSYTGLAILDDSGNVVDFSTFATAVDMYPCPYANIYDPYCALQTEDEMFFIRYSPENKTFKKICVGRYSRKPFSHFFIDETVFLNNKRLYRSSEDCVTPIEIELPWVCECSPEYSYHSVVRGTLSRLHMRLDGYNMVVDTLIFDGDYSCFTIETKSYNLLTILAENSVFYPISTITDVQLCRASIFSSFTHSM
ncbi:hypothetical protein PCE1_002935 [Barthelona sp. PCE]